MVVVEKEDSMPGDRVMAAGEQTPVSLPGIQTEGAKGCDILRLALVETLGWQAALQVMEAAGMPGGDGGITWEATTREVQAGKIQATLEKVYGRLAGRGLAQQAGRACLKYSLRLHGARAGLTDRSLRLLPLPKRLLAGSRPMAAMFSMLAVEKLESGQEAGHLVFHMARTEGNPCCAIAMGFLQEACYWLSGGRNYLVSETECLPGSDQACTILIDQVPYG